MTVSDQGLSWHARCGSGGFVQVIWGAATDTGRVRSVNEDALLAAPPVFVVSDGMGGHAAGDIAAATVIEEFDVALGPDSGNAIGAAWVRDCVTRAGRRIRAGAGGGATVVGAAVIEQDGTSYWLAFNLGDSRVYLCADGDILQVSVDHSYVQELVEAGELEREEMRRHPQRHVITRAVGLAGDTDLDCWLIPAREHERLLLCSDGVTAELTDEEMQLVLAVHADPQQAADALVGAAVAAGGRDNATAVVIDVLAVSGAGDRSEVTSRPDSDDQESDHFEVTLRRRLPQQSNRMLTGAFAGHHRHEITDDAVGDLFGDLSDGGEIR